MKTASELGISVLEYLAMKNVRDGLREGRFVHVKLNKVNTEVDDDAPRFCMSYPMETKNCGTVGCIGGWMAIEMQMSAGEADNYVYSEKSAPLEPLFFPHDFEGPNGEWDHITPKRAAKAIDNFLNTGSPQWEKVLPESSYI